MSMRTEQEIRDHLKELDELQKAFAWTDADRAVHAKITLRAQMKGHLYALREEKDFKIVSGS